MNVVVTDEAEADLEAIGDYIAEDNPRRAITFVREIRSAAERLSETPLAYPLVARYEHHGIRRRPYGNYLIFYRVDDAQISIVHIVHGARDYEAILFPQPDE